MSALDTARRELKMWKDVLECKTWHEMNELFRNHGAIGGDMVGEREQASDLAYYKSLAPVFIMKYESKIWELELPYPLPYEEARSRE